MTKNLAASVHQRLLNHAPIDQAGPEAGCTTPPAKLATIKPMSRANGQDRRRPSERHGLPIAAVVVAEAGNLLDGFVEGSPNSLARGSRSCES